MYIPLRAGLVDCSHVTCTSDMFHHRLHSTEADLHSSKNSDSVWRSEFYWY